MRTYVDGGHASVDTFHTQPEASNDRGFRVLNGRSHFMIKAELASIDLVRESKR
jgi:hypothetical protein